MKKPLKEVEFLGKEVKVIIDRPINSRHPRFNFKYEVNYGFIPDTLGGDGMEIDAYILGKNIPLSTFQGIVKAVIFRKNDVENKLVVTNAKYILNVEEVLQKTFFQEQFFQTEIKLLQV